MPERVYFIIGCWIVLALFWWVTSLSVKEAAEKQPPHQRLAQMGYTFVSFFLLWSVLRANAHTPVLSQTVIPQTKASLLIGSALCVVGLFVALWARTILGRNWSSTVTFKRDHELIQSGPYRFVRHPIYTGILLMYVASVIVIGKLSGFLGFPILFIGYWTKYQREEALMAAHFPDTYPGYKSRVKALVPFVF